MSKGFDVLVSLLVAIPIIILTSAFMFDLNIVLTSFLLIVGVADLLALKLMLKARRYMSIDLDKVVVYVESLPEEYTATKALIEFLEIDIKAEHKPSAKYLILFGDELHSLTNNHKITGDKLKTIESSVREKIDGL